MSNSSRPLQVHPTTVGGLIRPHGHYAGAILYHLALMLTNERTRENMAEYVELIGERMDQLAKHRPLDENEISRMHELHRELSAAISDDLPYAHLGGDELDHLAEDLAEVTIEMHRAAGQAPAEPDAESAITQERARQMAIEVVDEMDLHGDIGGTESIILRAGLSEISPSAISAEMDAVAKHTGSDGK
jgi:hypothetical protein